jgi:hypothetical protein
MNNANKHSLQMAESLDDLATLICSFGYYAYHNDDRERPIPKDAVREYLEVGAAFQMKETEPKLQKLKKLADDMYHAAQYLTTDASHLRKAMDEYQQFVIQNKI